MCVTFVLALCAIALQVDHPEPPTATPATLRLIDVNDDGRPDRIAVDETGALEIAIHVGGRDHATVFQALPAVRMTDVLVGDLDSDGLPDLYIVSPGENVVLLGDGTGRFREAADRLGLSDGGVGRSAERLDVDGDGFPEVLLHNEDTDVLFWATGSGTYQRDGSPPAEQVKVQRATVGPDGLIEPAMPEPDRATSASRSAPVAGARPASASANAMSTITDAPPPMNTSGPPGDDGIGDGAPGGSDQPGKGRSLGFPGIPEWPDFPMTFMNGGLTVKGPRVGPALVGLGAQVEDTSGRGTAGGGVHAVGGTGLYGNGAGYGLKAVGGHGSPGGIGVEATGGRGGVNGAPAAGVFAQGGGGFGSGAAANGATGVIGRGGASEGGASGDGMKGISGTGGVGTHAAGVRGVAGSSDAWGMVSDGRMEVRGQLDVRSADPGQDDLIRGFANASSTIPSFRVLTNGSLWASSTGSLELLLEADSDNAGELDHPVLTLSQDRSLIRGQLGFFDGGNSLHMRLNWADDLVFETAGIERMRVAASGKVGVRTDPDDWNADLTADAEGETIGILGNVSATTGGGLATGVYGVASVPAGGRGVVGVAPDIGVLGETETLNGFGVFANGDLGTSGAKPFVHPHPTDPSKQIHFLALEGNESGTYFRGSTTLTNGVAVIPVPEEFRLVTNPEDLTAVVTVVGEPAQVWIASKSLQQIVVQGDADVTIDYIVNGLRRGYEDYALMRANTVFKPEVRGRPYGMQFPEAYRSILVDNGLLNNDFTPNEATIARLGWSLRDRPLYEDVPGEDTPEPEGQ